MSLPLPEIKKIKITDLSPNDYNPQEMPKDKYKGLVGHMRSVGFTDPLKIRSKGDEDPETIKTPYVLVDGEHRLRAFMEVFSEEDEILCAIMKGPSGNPLSRTEAVISTIAYNFQHGDENPIKMASALKIALDDGILMEDIEDLTGMKRNRIENFMDFSNLPVGGGGAIDGPGFEGSGGGDGIERKEAIIISFSVYPEDRVKIEAILKKAEKFLEPETDIDEARGKQLLIALEGSEASLDERLKSQEG